MFQASGGYLTSAFVSPQQTVWMCGAIDNPKEKLGGITIANFEQDEDDPQILKKVKNLVEIACVSAGYAHTLCLDIYGNVFSFGSNGSGQLGNDREHSDGPERVENLPKIKSISAGNHSLCLDENGFIWGFGKNSNYECYPVYEENRVTNIRTPRKLDFLPNIKIIRSGYSHSVCSDESGKVWAFGSNLNGQLGTSNNIWDKKAPFREVTSIGEVSQISVGYSHSVVLNKNNECFVFGYNSQGQLGIGVKGDVKEPTKLDYEVEFIQCGYFHTFIRTTDGRCLVSGNNNYGQLGLGHSEYVNTIVELPYRNMDVVLMGGLHSIYVTDDRKYLCSGWNTGSQCCVNGTTLKLTEIPYDNLACVLTFNRAKSARK